MDEFKSIEGWKKIWRICLNQGLLAVLLLGLYLFASNKGWLSPAIRLATAQEVVAIQQQIAEQNRQIAQQGQRYSEINRALLEIRIGQAQASIREMQRDADARRAAGQPVPLWLDEQIRDMTRRLEKLKHEADK